MKFIKGDRIKLRFNLKLENDVIPKGTEGIVTRVLRILELYVIDFDSGHSKIRVSETRIVSA
jgi:hypothetical protein